MFKLSIDTDKGPVSVQFDASADIMGCIITGVTAALPAFLDAFIRCIGGGSGTGGLNPGGPPRCG